jgi:ParB-like chromosome segregation protein Spo0J
MQLVDVDPRTLHPADYNPRRMSEHDGNNLIRSLKNYGVIENVVVNRRSGNIVSGHMRVLSAIKAGIPAVPVHYIDVDDVTERQINLTMNRTRGEWDDQGVAELLAYLATQEADLSLTGFQDAEIANLMDGVCDVGLDPPPPADFTAYGDDIETAYCCPKCGYEWSGKPK